MKVWFLSRLPNQAKNHLLHKQHYHKINNTIKIKKLKISSTNKNISKISIN